MKTQRWTLAVVLILVVCAGAWAQEYRLEFSYAKDAVAKFKRTVRTQTEGALVEGGRSDRTTEFFYTLQVDDVLPDGSAIFIMTCDSAVVRSGRRIVHSDGALLLKGMRVAVTVGRRGQIVELATPRDAPEIALEFLDNLIAEWDKELLLPGGEYESGGRWHQERYVVLNDGGVRERVLASLDYSFARTERLRGVEGIRIDYGGYLTSEGNRVGQVKGSALVAVQEGRKIRESLEIEAALNLQRGQARMQWRYKRTQTLEALN